jgi:trehalose 6-phosphate phosphatase
VSAHPELQPLLEDPGRAAILTDIDGTLAPIVDDPAAAAVPAQTRSALEALAGRFALVGCISGRRAAEARELVGIDGIAYAGNHGLEILRPGETEISFDPGVAGREEAAVDFLAEIDRDELARHGLRVEDKGPIQALHWRGAPNEEAAERQAEELAESAERDGDIEPRWGRKVLELRPAGGGDKGHAIANLVGGEIDAAVYAGDDRTDIDAFVRLREMADTGELKSALCVGVVSPEAPPGLADASDITVDGPGGWLDILAELAF